MKLSIRAFAVISLFFGLLLLGGCASMGDMVGHHSAEDFKTMSLPDSAARTYAASLDEVKQAIKFSLKESGLENIEEHQTDAGVWYATAEVGYSWRSNGQFVRMAARPEQQGATAHTVVLYTSIKRYEINVTEDLSAVRDKLLNLVDSYIEAL